MDSVYRFFFFKTKRIVRARERKRQTLFFLRLLFLVRLNQRNIYKSNVGCRVFSHHTYSGKTEASATDADNRTYCKQRERETETERINCTEQYCLLVWKRRTSPSSRRRHDNIYIYWQCFGKCRF